ncbi:MAG: beta-propeller fold lactonase family protein [Gammaproteobacteria bacterium]
MKPESELNPIRYIANEGSVTVIDLTTGQLKDEVIVELHASALAASPNGQYVVVANSGSDTLSVIDTKTDQIIEKIWMRQSPGDLFGAQPNALAFHPDGTLLFVCNGTQNAVAVIQFEPTEKESSVVGLIPVGWFPGAVAVNITHKLICVANIKGIGAA